MKTCAMTGVISTVLIAVAAPAQAMPTGRLSSAEQFVPRYVVAQKVGGCVVRKSPKVAARFVLAESDDSSNRASPSNEFVYVAEPCLVGQFDSVHLDGLELRGAMAEAMLKDHDTALLRRVRMVAPRRPERVAPPGDGAPNFALFACAVAAMPAQAAAMLDSAPGTPGEATAFQAIGPALQACAPADVALHVKPNNVRWLVATALYRLAAKA